MPAPCAKNDLLVVVTSVGTEEQALDIAHALVRSRRAACVNIDPQRPLDLPVERPRLRRRRDAAHHQDVASQFEGVRETIHKMNTYELPEVLAYRVDMASPGFLSWIEKMTASTKRKVAGKAKARKPAARKSARKKR